MKKSMTYTIDGAVVEALRQLSKETRVPISRYVEEALEDLLKKYRTVG